MSFPHADEEIGIEWARWMILKEKAARQQLQDEAEMHHHKDVSHATLTGDPDLDPR